MKRCPKCQRTYEDDSLNFCLDDGSVLLLSGAGVDTAATAVLETTETKRSPGAPVATQPTIAETRAAMAPPVTTAPTHDPDRFSLLWVAAGVVGLFLAVAAVGAVLIALSMFRTPAPSSSESDSNSSPANSTAANTRNQNGNMGNQNNGNGTSGNSSNASGDMIADISATRGRYVGRAVNSSYSPPLRGRVDVEIVSANEATGAVVVRMNFSQGLCGAGVFPGKITHDGRMDLSGVLYGNNVPNCGVTVANGAAHCRFTTSNSFGCACELYIQTAVGQVTQRGTIEATKVAGGGQY